MYVNNEVVLFLIVYKLKWLLKSKNSRKSVILIQKRGTAGIIIMKDFIRK